MKNSALKRCPHTRCRACTYVEEDGHLVGVCIALNDTEGYHNYCPFFKTPEQYEAERERLARLGHRIEYEEAKP